MDRVSGGCCPVEYPCQTHLGQSTAAKRRVATTPEEELRSYRPVPEKQIPAQRPAAVCFRISMKVAIGDLSA